MKQQAFLDKINPVKDKMYRLALRLLISKEAAEDATQEVIFKLWARKDKLKDYTNVEAFAMTTTKNYCLDELKAKKNNNLRIVHQNYENNSISLQRGLEVKDEMHWVDKIVNELPEQQKIAFQLRDIEQLEFEEIIEITKMKPTAVRVALSRARKKIRESLTNKHNYGITKN
ncbi:RNA polymerase sigma factor [Salegentibacter salegens]|uniref:RNA polymerase sigma-70 factor, ECF subfamily n=1 Tax=Salegentibacter salegens TaxID=143223 RepID=A0A1M7JF25_9FLAO|nr:RNA polymerase sigma factor [Salegentibacter salegens]PRX42820.1 RNA polymerase sigma-70 factor (ECF subfamily) [Salegentibacter salegens]SHM51127.1 RNA polymerase sigma-70 factor, ECF subfamily [Salegentibacter salegens]